MKKLLTALVVAASLVFAPIVMAKPALDPMGIKASHKSLELQYVCDTEGENCISWLMIEDRLRVKERNRNLRHTPSMVQGFLTPSGNYFVMITMGWMRFPLGEMPVEWIKNTFPFTKEIFERIVPSKFQTFTGFEDIWWYFDISAPGHEEEALRFIRELNQEDLRQYNGNGGR